MRKPTLSPSKISTYLACPVKYKWTYIDPRGKWYVRSKSHFSFGSSLHHVLQRFHDSKDQGVTTVEEAVAAVDESWIDAGYVSAQEMQESLGEGKLIIQAYVENMNRIEIADTTLYVEKQLRTDLGDFVLLGRIDRIDERPDGSLNVIDYKSKRSDVTVEEVHDDLAMGCYQILVRSHFENRPVTATILAIRTGNSASASLTDVEAAQFVEDLKMLGTEILNRDFEDIEPVPKQLCITCDFLPLCKKSEGFEDSLVSLIQATS